MTAKRLAVLDLPEGNAMRAPGETPGLMALEIAMDEMAEKLGMDPVEFRILNDTQVDPGNPARPFSQRQLVECLRIGAERFGWNKRQAAARPSPRRALAGRHGRRRRVPQQSGDEVGRARPARQQGQGDGRDRHDRHRHRQLHDHRPDRRRDDGRAARQGRRSAWAIPVFRSRPARVGNGAPTARPPASMPPASSCARRRRAVWA